MGFQNQKVSNSSHHVEQLSILNKSRWTLPGPIRLHELVVSTMPDKVAIDFLDADGSRQQLTYHSMIGCARRLSAQLRSIVGSQAQGNVIPVIMPQCPELYISYLAILGAGAAFCPLQPDIPVERLKFVVHDVDAKLVLTTTAHASRVAHNLPSISCQVVSLLELQSSSLQPSALSPVAIEPGENDVAYVMYTSGSTGLPKGVRLSHISVIQSLLAHDEHIPPFQRFLQFASPTFDVSVFEIFFSFFRGATVACCERERMLANLAGAINALNVDAIELTPTVAAMMLRRRNATPNLKILLTIGEMLNRSVIEEFGGSETRESMLYAMYGPTEASIHCTIAPKLSATSSVRNIGVPLSTVTALILSETPDPSKLHILPVGHVGELAIAGQLAEGYLNRPKETMTAFIEVPEFGKVYRTGDRAFVTNDNTLQILGRISDDQVKLRGQRIELGEIEEVACKNSIVTQAVASVIDQRIVLFCAGSTNLSRPSIQATCRSWLPQFMWPSEIILLPGSIPSLPSGKVDRQKLVREFRTEPSTGASMEDGSLDEVTQRVADIVEQELGTQFGMKTSLWASGLDSLKCIKIASKLQYSFPQATMMMLMESETIKDIVAKLSTENLYSKTIERRTSFKEDEAWDNCKTSLLDNLDINLARHEIEKVLPCDRIQIAMLTETLADERLNFNTIHLHYANHEPAFNIRLALGQIADQNEILRSGFIATDFAEIPFVQVVWKNLSFDHDLSILHPIQVYEVGGKNISAIKIHHAIYDGWSWDLVMSDLNQLATGGKVAVRPQFTDFRKLANSWRTANHDNDTTYWSNLIRDIQPRPFPCLRPGNAVENGRRSCRRILCSKTGDASIETFLKSTRVTRQIVIQTAYLLLLSAYCDTSDILYGVVSSGREAPFEELQRLIGPCLTIYPMRIDLKSIDNVRDLLYYVQRTNIDHLKHGTLSLSEIKQLSNVPKAQMLFDAIFVWQEGPESTHHGPCTVTVLDTCDALKYCLHLEAGRQDDHTWVKLTYDECRIPVEHAELFLQQIDGVVAAMIEHPMLAPSKIWMSIDDEALSKTNPNPQSFDGLWNLSTTIETLAQDDPDRTALEFVTQVGDDNTQDMRVEKLSYRDLYMRSASIAKVLVSPFRMGNDQLICIHMEKSTELYIAILATVLSGSGYMCIDPVTPDIRMSRIVREAQCKLIITNEVTRLKKLIDSDITIITFSELSAQRPYHQTELPRHSTDQSLAYAVFTSGSTGTPKGVLITRKNIISNIGHLATIYPCDPASDKLLQACSQAFDVSVFEIFWTWHMGLTLCSARNDILFRDIEGFIRSMSITHLSMTPSVAALIEPSMVPTVKMLVTAGEPMNMKVFNSWKGKSLYQGYGPSETTNICNINPRVSSNDLINNVGPAFSNTSIFICARQRISLSSKKSSDSPSNPPLFDIVPVGAVGEIWIGGDQVGRGYVDSELTAKSWVKHPHYGMLYKSGDIGRLLSDDSLIVLGREDDQVKLRGQRIELGEVNAALTRHPGVKDAFTLLVDKVQATRLISFIVGNFRPDDSQPDLSQGIFQTLQHRLSDYMIPDLVIPLDRMPLSRQGKIDQQALRQIFDTLNDEDRSQYSRSREVDYKNIDLSTKEITIAQLLADVTGAQLNSISRHSSFYDIGLDSISGIKFAQALRKGGFRQADVSIIFKNASISRLLPVLHKPDLNGTEISHKITTGVDQQRIDSICSQYKNEGYTIARILPCTPLQEFMLSSQSDDESSTYWNHLRWKVEIDIETVRKAWKEMVERHDLLRTVFVETKDLDTPYLQLVLKNFELPWTTSELIDCTVRHKANLNMPPYQFHVSRSSGNESTLLHLVINHAIYDAHAMVILLREVEDVIHKRQQTRSYQFAAYINYMSDMNLEETDRFWSKLFADVQPTRLSDLIPLSETSSTTQTSQTTKARSRLSVGALETFAKAHSISVLTVLQTTLARLLMYLTKSVDICFGNVYNGRNLPIEGIDSIVGPCFNTLPMRAHATQSGAIYNLQRQLHDQTLNSLQYQPSSLRRIQKQISPDGRRLFDILLLFQQEESVLDPSIWALEEDNGDMDFPFILEIVPQPQQTELRLKLHHRRANYNFAQKFLHDFDLLMEQTINYPQALSTAYTNLDMWLPVTTAQKISGSTNGILQNDLAQKWTAKEQQIRIILQDLSGASSENMCPTTNIFQLGLDSISAVQLAIRLREKGYEISAADVLEHVTVRDIAKNCVSRDQAHTQDDNRTRTFMQKFDHQHRKTIAEQCEIDQDTIECMLPCTSAQAGILSQFLSSNGSLYYNRTRLALDKELDISRLKQCWSEVTAKTEILRAGFWPLNIARHSFAMIIYKPYTFGINWQQLETLYKTDTPSQEIRKPKDLYLPAWEIMVSQDYHGTVVDVWLLHALYDARALEFILGDVATLYTGGLLQRRPSITVIVAKILEQSQESSEAEKFWKENARNLEYTKFPDLSIYRQPFQRLVSAAHTSRITIQNARAKCSLLGVSLQSVCQAAWAKLLAMYCGQAAVCFGVILSGRSFHDENLNGTLFPCINTVPFAATVSEDNPDLLRSISNQNVGLLRYQHTPMTTIKKWVGMTENLFDTVFVLQQFSRSIPTQELWKVVEDEASSEYVVSLEVLPKDKSYQFQLTFRPDRIPPEQASIILEEYEAILNGLLEVHNKDRDITNLKILSALPPKVAAIPTDTSYLHQLVERTVAMKPNATALEYVTSMHGDIIAKQTWAYQQLNDRGNQIANLLIQNHAQVGQLVGVCFEKCPEASFAILGILKAGCAYVAIDPGAPIARKKFILQDADCKILLTTKNTGDLHDINEIIRLLVDDSGLLSGISKSQPVLKSNLTGEHPCYCLYTSGTTGTPKGCVISHTSAIQAMLSFSRIFAGRWKNDSRWLQFASFHFDVSVLEQYWSWSVGICVTSTPRDLLFEDLPGVIHKLGITHLDLTPSLAKLLRPESVPSLHHGVFIVGGEQVRQEILDTWGGVGCLYNFYGPSEVTIGCTVHPQVRKEAKPTNIGRQWDNVGSFVLNPQSDKPVIRGAIGELCLSGPLVGKGYLNRPELTAAKFYRLKDYDNARIYRTGDLVRMLHDGSFDFLGRTDDQVKLRGQRLEIGEINHFINGYSKEIEDVATLVIKHPVLQKEQLISFFSMSRSRKREQKMPKLLLEKHIGSLSKHIMRACRDKMPAYMVPTYFIGIEFMPLTANNKSDVKMLKQLYEEALANQTSADHQMSDETQISIPQNFDRLSEIVAGYLEIEKSKVKPSSGVFELGLDSISVIGLSRLLKRAGFKQADIPTIVKTASVLHLASILDSAKGTDPDDYQIDEVKSDIEAFSKKHSAAIASELGINMEEIEAVTLCTPLQSGMILKVLRSSDAENVPYFGRFTYELRNNISVDKLQQAWKQVARQLAILRTCFVATEDGYAQVVLKATKFAATHLFGNTGSRDVAQAFYHWINNSRNFGQCLPWYVVFTRKDDGSNTMTLCIFHGLYDGIALPLLLSLVKQQYLTDKTTGLITHQFHTILPYGPLSRLSKARDFWKDNLRQTTTLDLDSSSSQRAASTKFVNRVKYPGLLQICSQLNVTIPAVLHASWLHTLFLAFGMNPTIGVVVSGRAIPLDGAETIIGPMFNTVPCSIHGLPKKATVFDLIKACHEFNVASLPYQHTSLRDIARWAKQDRRRDLFDSLFVFQRSYMQKKTNDDEHHLWIEKYSDSQPDYSLNLEIDHINVGGEFIITVLAKEGQDLNERKIESLLETLEATVDQICKSGDFPLPLHFSRIIERHLDQLPNANEATKNKVEVASLEWTVTMDIIKDEVVRISGADTDSLGVSSPSLFELGLDSIDALKLAARLKTRQLIVSVGKIMQNPTIGGIAQHCKHRDSTLLKSKDERTVVDQNKQLRSIVMKQGIALDESIVVLPVTPMQEGLLLRFEDYYHVLVYQMNSHIDVERLSDAIFETANCLPVLKSIFLAVEEPSIEENFVQLVQKEAKIEINRVKLGSRKQIREISQAIKIDGLKFGLSGQSFQVTIAQIEDSSDIVLFGLPHAMYDGWSIELIHDAIRSAYNGKILRQDMSLVVDHIYETRRQSNSREVSQFWERLLKDVCPTHLAFPTSNVPISATLVSQPSEASLSLILEACKQAGITLQSFGLACWALLLAHKSKRLDVCHGLVLSGRTIVGSDQLAFPTFNTVIFRTQIQSEMSCSEFLQRVHETSLGVLDNQHFPLKKSLQIVRRSANGTLNTLFTFQRPPTTIRTGPVLYEEHVLEDQTVHPPYAVNVEMTEKDDALWWTCAVQDNIADELVVRDLLQQLDKIVQFLASSPSAKLIVKSEAGDSICGLSFVMLKDSLKMRSRQDDADNATQSLERQWTTTELTVRSVLAEVARVDESQIHRTTSIFHVGLDSVSAIKIAEKLRKKGLKLPVSQLIRAQNVEIMAKLTSAMEPEQVLPPTVGVAREDEDIVNLKLSEAGISLNEVENILPAAAGQIYMLDAWQASGGALFYVDFWFQATATTKETFEKSFTLLTQAVPAFRTSFVTVHNNTFAVTFKSNSISSIRYPWSLETKQKGHKVLARLRIHHALYDAVGLHIMVNRLISQCRDKNGTTSKLNTNFDPFLQLTRNGHSDAIRKRRDFWTSYLSNANARNRNMLVGTFSTHRTQKFVADLLSLEKLKPMLRTHGISIQMLFFAAYAKVHAALTGVKKGIKNNMVLLGIYLANRFLDVEGIDELVAPIFNILPLKIDVSSFSLLNIARNIQSDIRMVGQAQYCGTSLREIHSWTGLKLDGYMNFLRLPDDQQEEQDKTDGDHDNDVKVEHAEGESLYDTQSSFRDEARDTFTDPLSLGMSSPYLLDPTRQMTATKATAAAVATEPESKDNTSQLNEVADVSYIIPAIDVEARVMPDGNLAMGLFAPRDILSPQNADEVIKDVKDLLQEFINQNQQEI